MTGQQLSQQIEAGYHQFCLAPPGFDPILDPADAGPLLTLDREGPAVIVTTGCAQGPVNVTIRITQDPPPSLKTAGTGWEIGEQIAVDVTSDLYLLSMTPEGGGTLVYTAGSPGLHLVRVLARGRAAHYDAIVDEATEDYDITITPITTDPGGQTTGGDGR